MGTRTCPDIGCLQYRTRYRVQYWNIPISGHHIPISGFGKVPDGWWITYNSTEIIVMKLSMRYISKPSYYYDTIIHYYDKCHKGKQGVSYSHYDNIITQLSHYYDTIIISIITSIMTQQTIMTLLWHFYDNIMTILWPFYDNVITLLWQYYNSITSIPIVLHYYYTIMTSL